MPIERSQTRNTLIGAGIIVALVAITMLFFFVPNLVRLLQPSLHIIALMDDAGALQKESPVWLAGREIGTVESVGFRGVRTDSSERVAVRLRIPKKYAEQIRRDSEARITSERLIGEPVVDVTPGSPTAPPVENLDTLRLRPRGTLIAVMENAEALEASFDQLFAEMRASKAPAARRAQELRNLDRRLIASTAGMRQLMNDLETSPIQTFSDPAWTRMLRNLTANGRELNVQLRAAAERARVAHSDARPSLDRLAARADTIAGVLGDMEARVAHSGGGLLVRAQRDSAIVKGLHQAQVQLDSLITETKRNPLRFWF
jgi:ABC-type transporter Mla subunit MlaD